MALVVVDELVDGRLSMDSPKTAAGVRTLVMPSELYDELTAHIQLLGIEKGDLLFADASCGPLRRSNFRTRVFLPATKKAGLEGVTFHGLRHSAAAQWVASGIDPRTVQHRLGHSDPRLVLRLYAHASGRADQQAANESSVIFWGDQQPTVKSRYPPDTLAPVPT